MRRLFIGMVVILATVLAPVWVLAGNQEVAEKIATNLKESGQLHGYKIGVKFQDGTAWIRGQVSSREEMNTALKVVFQTPGVTRVVNNLTVTDEGARVNLADNSAPVGRSTLAFNSKPQTTSFTPSTGPSNAPTLQQATGAMAPEKFSRTPPAVPHADVAAIPFRPATTPEVSRASLETADLEPAPSPEQARAAVVQPRPIPIAFTQPVAPAPVPTPAPPAPQPAPQVAPQPMPQVATQPAPAMAPQMGGVPLPIGAQPGVPMPQYAGPGPGMPPPAYDQAHMPNYAWPSYAAHPNYAALTYPKQYSPTAWPYVGPFYPYPQVPLGWRKVTLEWHDGWWNLDFDDGSSKGWFSGLFRPCGR
jgi:hypothetical protein